MMSNAFLEHRPLLVGIAYRMLGSVADAEDAVQDVYLRWQKESGEGQAIRSDKAWMITVTTRLCIDRLRSARRRREEYFGVWLPEPFVQFPESSSVALAESLSTAFMLMLETLSPEERAIFLLHEAFDYSHAEIAGIVQKSEANCRQIIRRARQHLVQRRERARADPEDAEALVQRFLAASRSGGMEDLLSVLTADATLVTDGGGKVRASPTPIVGAERIRGFLLAVRPKIPGDALYRVARVNGGIGVVIFSAGLPFAALTFAFEDGRICDIYSVSNPDKLHHLASNQTA